MTQWRTGFAGATGLDYGAVAVAARAIGVEMDGPVFDRLRVLEEETMSVWAEQAKADAARKETRR